MRSTAGKNRIPDSFFLFRSPEEIERDLDALLSAAEDGQLITGTWNEAARETFAAWLSSGIAFRMTAQPRIQLSDPSLLMHFDYWVEVDTPWGEDCDFYPFSAYAGVWKGRLYLNWEEDADSARSIHSDDHSIALPYDFFDRDPEEIRQDLTRLIERVPHFTPNPRFVEDFPQTVERLRSLRAQE